MYHFKSQQAHYLIFFKPIVTFEMSNQTMISSKVFEYLSQVHTYSFFFLQNSKNINLFDHRFDYSKNQATWVKNFTKIQTHLSLAKPLPVFDLLMAKKQSKFSYHCAIELYLAGGLIQHRLVDVTHLEHYIRSWLLASFNIRANSRIIFILVRVIEASFNCRVYFR